MRLFRAHESPALLLTLNRLGLVPMTKALDTGEIIPFPAVSSLELIAGKLSNAPHYPRSNTPRSSVVCLMVAAWVSGRPETRGLAIAALVGSVAGRKSRVVRCSR